MNQNDHAVPFKRQARMCKMLWAPQDLSHHAAVILGVEKLGKHFTGFSLPSASVKLEGWAGRFAPSDFQLRQENGKAGLKVYFWEKGNSLALVVNTLLLTLESQEGLGETGKGRQMEIICSLRLILCPAQAAFQPAGCQQLIQGNFKYSSQKNVAPSCAESWSIFSCLKTLSCILSTPTWFHWNLKWAGLGRRDDFYFKQPIYEYFSWNWGSKPRILSFIHIQGTHQKSLECLCEIFPHGFQLFKIRAHCLSGKLYIAILILW